jgi:hypothetical protein
MNSFLVLVSLLLLINFRGHSGALFYAVNLKAVFVGNIKDKNK